MVVEVSVEDGKFVDAVVVVFSVPDVAVELDVELADVDDVVAVSELMDKRTAVQSATEEFI